MCKSLGDVMLDIIDDGYAPVGEINVSRAIDQLASQVESLRRGVDEHGKIVHREPFGNFVADGRLSGISRCRAIAGLAGRICSALDGAEGGA